jgi:hypothetical protein
MGSFNGTLDSTVAIIIPVLFLALGVQRHLYQDLLQAYYNAARELRQRARPGTRMVPPLLITVVTGAVTTFILVYGTVGEVDAISARRAWGGRGSGSAQPTTRSPPATGSPRVCPRRRSA